MLKKHYKALKNTWKQSLTWKVMDFHCIFRYTNLYHDFAAFPLIYAVQQFPQDPVKRGAYN